MSTTLALSYRAGQQQAFTRVKIASPQQMQALKQMLAPTAAGAAIGGIGGAAMAPEGEGVRGALVGGSIGAAGGALGSGVGHAMGQRNVSRAHAEQGRLLADMPSFGTFNTDRAAKLKAITAKAMESQNTMQQLGGAAGAGSAGYLGAQAARRLPEHGVSPMPYEDDPYAMSQAQR